MNLRFVSLLALAAASVAPLAAQSSAPSVTLVGRAVTGRFLVSYKNGVVPADASPRAALAGARVVARHDRLGMALVQTSGPSAEAARAALAADPAVEFVAEDRIVTANSIVVRGANLTPTTPAVADGLYYSAQGWAVKAVGGQTSTWTTTRGKGVRIAILDSGVDAQHPDLAPNLALNLSEVDQTAATGMPSVCDDGTPQDQQGHGTWSASLAAAALGANTGQVAGVAPEATILNIKVLERMPSATTNAADPTGCNAGQASGMLSWVIQGIEDAVANHADIVSLSLGTMVDITTGDGAGLKAIFDSATHAAANQGTVLIAAAGNDGFNFANQRYIELPAMSRDVLAVVASTNPACAENLAAGATCVAGAVTLPYYSNYGAPMDALAAPGGSYPAGPDADPSQASGWIVGACSDGKPATVSGAPADSAHSFGCFGLGHVQYVQAMGTSASAPLTAGAAALLLSANPTWSAAQVVASLRASAVAAAGMPVGLVSVAATLAPAAYTTHNQHIERPGLR